LARTRKRKVNGQTSTSTSTSLISPSPDTAHHSPSVHHCTNPPTSTLTPAPARKNRFHFNCSAALCSLLLRTQTDVRYGCGRGCGALGLRLRLSWRRTAAKNEERREEMATVDAVSETEFENGPGGRVGYPTFDDAPFINRPILIVDGGSENYPIQNKWIRSVCSL